MPTSNEAVAEEETLQFRDAAAQEGTRPKGLAHRTFLAERRRHKVRAAALRTARISAGLSKRLAEK